jgi:hypothetical protein
MKINQLTIIDMANTSITQYVLCGKADEIKSLYEIMVDIQKKGKNPITDYCFWLGDLVTALGKDWHNIYCRGEWSNLEMTDKCTLMLMTETAWAPMNEVFDLICSEYPSIDYYYQSEEDGCSLFWVKDNNGMYFPERYILDLCTPKGEYLREYFTNEADAFKTLSEMSGREVHSEEDVEAISADWDQYDDSYCMLHRFEEMA